MALGICRGAHTRNDLPVAASAAEPGVDDANASRPVRPILVDLDEVSTIRSRNIVARHPRFQTFHLIGL